MSKDVVTCRVNMNGIGEKLLDLESKIARSLLRKSLKAVGTFWVDAVKAHVPVDTGELRDSINMKLSTRKGRWQSGGLPSGVVTVGPTYTYKAGKKSQSASQSPGVYGMFVEFGLKTKRYPKQPFLRPTFDTTGQQAVDIFAQTMMSGLEEAIKD